MARSAGRSARKTSAKRKDRTKTIDRVVEVRLTDAVKKNVGDFQTLAEFYSTAGELSGPERRTIVEQALLMIEQTYVHLPLKWVMHAVAPVQRLKLLKQRLDSYSERAFHNEMISIFIHLR